MLAKTRISFAFLVGLNCSAYAFAAGEAPITGVILYPGSATVERTAQVTAGMTQMTIKGLPANFDPQTIRVQADPGINIGQIVIQDVGRTESANAREAEIETKIQELEDRQAVLDVDAKSAALVQNYLERLSGTGTAATDKQQPYIDAKSMAGVIETIRTGARDAFDRMQRVEVQKREIGKKIEALQRDLARLRTGARDVRDITIHLAATRAGSVKLSYQANGAGWKPTYRAMLDSSASTVELERLATVSQKTGEDWSGVKLKLSTGQPRLSPQAPEPRPWLLSYRKIEPRGFAGVMAPAMAPVQKLALEQRQASLNEEEQPYAAPVIETQGTFVTEFEVPARVNLPTDGRELSVALSKQTVSVKQRVRVAPRLDKAAVVTAEADRPSGVWLPGSIQLFRDGNYVGATYWNTQSSDRLMFSFGRDDLMRVTVDRISDQSGTIGLLTPHAERKVADLYTLTSFHKTSVELLVLESSPVSTSDEIKVQVTFNPPPTTETWDRRQGVVAWEKTVAPNETLKFSVDYRITYPKDGAVGGLP